MIKKHHQKPSNGWSIKLHRYDYVPIKTFVMKKKDRLKGARRSEETHGYFFTAMIHNLSKIYLFLRNINTSENCIFRKRFTIGENIQNFEIEEKQ